MIAYNLKIIREKIIQVAEGCGRDPAEIQLIAVSKKFPSSSIEEAARHGQTLFGENYIQEASEKVDELTCDVQLHFIGHLQSNKAKTAARIFHMIETVDNFKLARALNKHAEEIQRNLKILIQVNIGKDPRKSGVLPDDARKLLEDISTLPRLEPCGLMTMPPFVKDPEEARPHFYNLRRLSEELASQGFFKDQPIVELSMGMSSDYHVAIEEGATLIRVGTAIFGQRK